MDIEIYQGDILKIERIKNPVLVVSKNFFNKTGMIIGCPLYNIGTPSTLHLSVVTDGFQGIVHCEKLNLFDLTLRGHSRICSIRPEDIINIADAIQGIFDYI